MLEEQLANKLRKERTKREKPNRYQVEIRQ